MGFSLGESFGKAFDKGANGFGSAMASVGSGIATAGKNTANWAADRGRDAGEFIGDRAEDVKDGAAAVGDNMKDRAHAAIDPRGFQKEVFEDMQKDDKDRDSDKDAEADDAKGGKDETSGISLDDPSIAKDEKEDIAAKTEKYGAPEDPANDPEWDTPAPSPAASDGPEMG